jgi:hypothetical protein
VIDGSSATSTPVDGLTAFEPDPVEDPARQEFTAPELDVTIDSVVRRVH